MTFNPLTEVRYGYKLAVEHLERAERLFSLKDWAGTVSTSQLAIENFAKAIIAVFEVPTWSHDPSNQLIGRLPAEVTDDIRELAALAREMAPEHGRSSYGEPTVGLLPSEIYGEDHASNALRRGKEARAITERVLDTLNVEL
ncbi:MAG: HEPN domain-containing protein [Candidatus Korarchaeum sp.]